jgi:hypothetical protein
MVVTPYAAAMTSSSSDGALRLESHGTPLKQGLASASSDGFNPRTLNHEEDSNVEEAVLMPTSTRSVGGSGSQDQEKLYERPDLSSRSEDLEAVTAGRSYNNHCGEEAPSKALDPLVVPSVQQIEDVPTGQPSLQRCLQSEDFVPPRSSELASVAISSE